MDSAQSLDRGAVESLVRAHYPRVCRIALAMCGREDVGRATVRTVLRQSLKILPSWRNAGDASNWFLHHTILSARDKGRRPIEAPGDCLVQRFNHPTTEYIAFVRALRHLDPQQQEAFMLARGEQLDNRHVAVAMDCSMAAAANHLAAATKSLSAIAGDVFELQATALAGVYASLTPPEEMILDDVSAMGERVSRRKAKYMITTLLQLAFLAALAWIIWRLSKMIII